MVNAGHNQLVRFDGVRNATELRALILNNNRLVRLDSAARLVQLNTLGAPSWPAVCAPAPVRSLARRTAHPLDAARYGAADCLAVVSHNAITSLEGVSGMSVLTTLAIAHNQLRELPSLAFAPTLEQLRLNDNKLMTLGKALNANARSARIGRTCAAPSRNSTHATPQRPPAACACTASNFWMQAITCCERPGGIRSPCAPIATALPCPQTPYCRPRCPLHSPLLGANHCPTHSPHPPHPFSDVACLNDLPLLANLNLKGNPLCSSSNYPDEVR